jgi:hypothetical protein
MLRRYILRHDLARPVPLVAGQEVLVPPQVAPGAQQLPVLLSDGTEGMWWLPRTALLPGREFLVRQPLTEFYALARRDRVREQQPDCFVTQPGRLIYGLIPFRFESAGEARYWLRQQRLSADQFYEVHYAGFF